jgi:hypothetical protein
MNDKPQTLVEVLRAFAKNGRCRGGIKARARDAAARLEHLQSKIDMLVAAQVEVRKFHHAMMEAIRHGAPIDKVLFTLEQREEKEEDIRIKWAIDHLGQETVDKVMRWKAEAERRRRTKMEGEDG